MNLNDSKLKTELEIVETERSEAESARQSVPTVLTIYSLYWTSFVQKYHIYNEQYWKIKSHFEYKDPVV